MKVFQINTVYNTGSTGRIVAQLKHAIEACGGECVAAYGRGSTDEQNTYKIGNKLDMCYHALMTRLTDKTGFYSKRNTQRLIKKIQEFDPDIIHLHNLHGYYINIETLFSFLKRYNKPVVWTLHDCWSYTGHCAYYSAVKCNQWKNHCEKCVQKEQYPMSKIKDNCFFNYEKKKKIFTGVRKLTIITPSQWLKDELKQSFMQSYDVECIYNGIDLSIFHPLHSELRKKYALGNRKIILCVANVWSDRKGLSRILELSKRVDSNQYAIAVIGLSKKQLKQMPESLISLERTTNIEELVEWYSIADIYFNASVEETLGLTTIEALACGTPAIVFNSTAIAETVDETCGMVIEDFEDNDWFDNMIRVIEDPQNVVNDKNVAKACMARAKEFGLQRMEEGYLKIYRDNM